uniref:WAP domain-containing protein n=1 Tax=Periophthalmus magnuspinnatus TaxID=409849 RepID=A0A3B3ZUQ4_9GOBI
MLLTLENMFLVSGVTSPDLTCNFIFTEPKPGSCPRPVPHFIICRKGCTDDRQCPRNLKCCYSNCGFQCVPPEHV